MGNPRWRPWSEVEGEHEEDAGPRGARGATGLPVSCAGALKSPGAYHIVLPLPVSLMRGSTTTSRRSEISVPITVIVESSMMIAAIMGASS